MSKPYQQWLCVICGWIYDEALGVPEDGIEPGTRWEDVPDDWTCPDCGVGKEDFEMIPMDVSPAPTPVPEAAAPPAVESWDVVIIGAGLAGYNLVRALRKLDTQSRVLLITQDDGAFYSKPLLSTGYTKQQQAAELIGADAEKMAADLDITVRCHCAVTDLDRSKKLLTTDQGSVCYAKLVLAVGGQCIEPPVAGDAAADIFQINTLQDYAQFRRAAEGKKRVLIIGAGLIGCEYANDMANGGYQIDMVDPMPRVLAGLLPDAASAAVAAGLQELGVTVHLNVVVEQLQRTRTGYAAQLSDGRVIECDLVLGAVGIRPRLDLANRADLPCARGISVDRYLATADPDIYALGDCAEVSGLLLYYVLPLMIGARALAKTLAGTPTPVRYDAMPVVIKTPACPTVVCPAPAGQAGQWQISGEGRDISARFEAADGTLLGFALTGQAVSQKMVLQKSLPKWLD